MTRPWARAAELAVGSALLLGIATRSGGGGRAFGPSLGIQPDPGPRSPPSGEVRALSTVPRIASYRLRASVDPALHSVRGEGEIEFVNASAKPLDALYVHLYLNAFEDDRTVFRRDRAAGFRGDTTAIDGGSIHVERFFVRELGAEVWPEQATTPGDLLDRTDIRVPLPRPLAPGERVTIETTFVSKLPSVMLRTGYAGSFHMVAQWFPKLARLESSGEFAHFPFERLSEFYADFGDYDVTIDVPRGFVVGATGKLDSEAVSQDRVVSRYLAGGVHDFAFAAWDGFAERRVQAGAVSLRCLYPRGFERAADLELEAASRGLEVYGDLFGAYPYETLTIVHPPGEAAEAGGMEYPTLITTGGPAWMAHVPLRGLELLTLHELGHQWFYGIVATNENSYPFLDEGLTTYATGEAARVMYGSRSVSSLLDLTPDSVERVRARGMPTRARVAAPAGEFATGSDYGGLVYARTATILRTIDRVWDGGALQAISAYARAQRFEHPGPEALSLAIGEHAGADARAFFDEAIFRQGWVDFEPVAVTTRGTESGGFDVEVVVRRRGTLVVPVEIDVTTEDGETRRFTWDGTGHSHELRFESASAPTFVRVDPEGRVLVDEDKLGDALAVDPASGAPRMRAWAWTAASLALTLTSP